MELKPVKIALVQTEVVDGRPPENLERVAAELRRHPGADLYVLPELWSTGYAYSSWAEAADMHTPAILEHLRTFSCASGMAIAGSLVSRDEDGRLVNRLWLVDRDAALQWYDKIHLFEPLREHEFLAAGRRPGILSLRGDDVSCSICFDLLFLELYRAAAVRGVRLFLVVAEWPERRQHILSTLARARAMENQSFVVLCNRVGRAADGLAFPGESAIYGPSGSELVCARDGRGVFQAELDLGEAAELRTRMPVLPKRVPGLDSC
jgi:omega-amidase